jgi:hypothetical protein
LPVEIAIVIPPADAFLLTVTVQVVEADGESAVGLQTSDETRVVDTRPMVAVAELPLYAAVIVTL